MSATIKMSEANVRKPGFSEGRPDGVPWKLTVSADSLDWEARCRFGAVRNVVVLGMDGMPAFERPEYREAPNTNIVAYGLKDGGVYIAILHEGRPHADDPTQEPGTENSPITFGQVPMGFKDKLFGPDAPEMEDTLEAAARELGEETGTTAIKRLYRPKYPFHNPNPTFVATWSDLVFAEVDLSKVGEKRLGRNELIYKAEYIPAKELITRIENGTHENAVYRAGTSLSILMIFFATHPEYFSKD